MTTVLQYMPEKQSGYPCICYQVSINSCSQSWLRFRFWFDRADID